MMDGRRSTSPVSRPAAPNLRFALARPSPSTAGTLARSGGGVDRADVGCMYGLLAGAWSTASLGFRSVPKATNPTRRSSPRRPLPVARAIGRGLKRPLLAASRRWWVHACPSQSRSRPDWSGSGTNRESAAYSLASPPRPVSAFSESPRRKASTRRNRQSRIRQARVARGKSTGLLRRAHS